MRKHSKILNQRKLLLFGALCANIAQANLNVEDAVDFLHGLRYRNETENGAMQYASMAGGMEIFIDGAGFDEQAHINTVMFNSLDVEDLLLAGPSLDIDDEIQSATTIGRLAYTLPSLPDLFGGVPMETFNQHYLANNYSERIRYEIVIQNNADNAFIPCYVGQTGDCEVFYQLRYTPILFDIIPSNVYLDQTLNFKINPVASNQNHVMRDDADPVDFIKFSGTRNDFEGLFDAGTRLSNYRVNNLLSRSGDQHPGNSIPEVRFRVGNALLRESSKHCNFAGDDCWYVKTHPKIDSVSAASGYTTGGQELTITGWGLKGETLADVEVLVDGAPCTVTKSTLEEIQCITSEVDAISNDGISQPGSPGLSQYKFNHPDGNSPWWDMRTDGQVEPSGPFLQTSFEVIENQLYRDGLSSRGWFKAPATGNYRFYISCNDACQMFMNTDTPFDKAAPQEAELTQQAIRHWYTEWRHYFVTPEETSSNQYISEWIALEEGEFYKVEGWLMEYDGGDHFTVSVEFEQADTAGHHHANKEIQILSYTIDEIAEEYTITVDTPSAEVNYQVQFLNPLYDPDDEDSVMLWKSEAIAGDASASTLQNEIKGYYSSIWGSNIDVAKVSFDEAGVETEDTTLTVKSVYTVTVKKRISQASFTSAMIITEGATVTVDTPTTLSSQPLGGKFKVTCPDVNGSLFSTNDIDITSWTEGIDFNMQLWIPHAQFKIYVRNLWTYDYRQNGLSFAVIWQDYHGDVPECYLESSEDNPITGDNPQAVSETIREYGQNLFFEPCPLEFLYTDRTQPQVLVTVNGIAGVCPDFNCDYIYVESAGQITGQTLSGNDLTIDGTNLPIENIKVRLANSDCDSATIVASETQITCTLTTEAAAGSWDVQITGVNGLIAKEASVATIDIGLTVDATSPNADLNWLGGNILVITGTGFDQILDNTSVSFNDNTVCNMLTTQSSQITCEVDGFDETSIDIVNPYSA